LCTKQSLKEHFYTHTRQKPYKCKEKGCDKVFRQCSQLSNHKKIHLEVKKVLMETSDRPVFEKESDEEFTSEENIKKLKIPLIVGPQMNIKLPALLF
jgi:hypothetical protein